MVEKKEAKEKEATKCSYCEKEIDFNLRHCLLGTYEGDKPIKEDWFHMHCFKMWHEEKVREKAQNIVASMQKQAMGMMQGLQGMIGNLVGGAGLDLTQNINLDVLKSNIPQKDAQDILDEVEEEKNKKKVKKKNDGRGKDL